MDGHRIVDVTDTQTLGLLPPCADPRFDHRTCDYWEDAERGSKAARPGWLTPIAAPRRPRPAPSDNPFAPQGEVAAPFNPFDPAAGMGAVDDPFSAPSDPLIAENPFAAPVDNPFAPQQSIERPLREGVPRKLALLERGRGIFGSYAKVLLVGEQPAAYVQFGPLSAYPRAIRLRDLYPQLPDAPLPAVITCVSSAAWARRQGYAARLVEAVCADLAGRGFSAVEAYLDLTGPEDETSTGRPAFWLPIGFALAVDDERYPVMRRELV
ncbi:MAG: GNAT family N-acetyltransferase [Chloroflexi bacterium]|nr:GNAT family N-acetyltransferase [Chloroflexota bacterium]